MIWHDPTHQPTHHSTHPPNHTPTHGWGISTDFKYSNKIELSWLVQMLSNFYWLQGSPLKGWIGMGVNMAVRGVSHACTHTHACMHMHVINMINVDTPMSVAICKFLYMYTCMCMHMHVHMCMDTFPISVDASRHPPSTYPSPELQGAQNTKIQ